MPYFWFAWLLQALCAWSASWHGLRCAYCVCGASTSRSKLMYVKIRTGVRADYLENELNGYIKPLCEHFSVLFFIVLLRTNSFNISFDDEVLWCKCEWERHLLKLIYWLNNNPSCCQTIHVTCFNVTCSTLLEGGLACTVDALSGYEDPHLQSWSACLHSEAKQKWRPPTLQNVPLKKDERSVMCGGLFILLLWRF